LLAVIKETTPEKHGDFLTRAAQFQQPERHQTPVLTKMLVTPAGSSYHLR
jgi:hypothetical protein